MPDKSLQIPTADCRADAFAAFPGNGGRHPGVLLYPDAFGVRPLLQQMARELAGRPTARTAFSPRSPPRSTSASPKAT